MEITPAKTCGPCNLCCKLVQVDSLAKPAGTWCKHALPGKGCAIHGAHPDDCRGYRCGWLESPVLGPEWRPNVSKFILGADLNGKRLCIVVNPAHPNAWKAQPYYNAIKEWSKGAWTNEGQVVVFVDRWACVVFPEEDLVVGPFSPGEELISGYVGVGAVRQPMFQLKRQDGTVGEGRGGFYPVS